MSDDLTYRDKLKGLSFSLGRKKSKPKPIIRDDNGFVGGFTIEHGKPGTGVSSSQDAQVNPPHIKLGKGEVYEPWQIR